MDDWTGIAYGAFGISSFISALRIGRWILNADPRAIINVGRWSSVCLAVLSLGVLLWLVVNGRWTHAMLLAAFILPVLAQAAPRWRLLFRPISFSASSSFPSVPDVSEGGHRENPNGACGSIDPRLAQQCAGVLEAYLKQTRRQIIFKPEAIGSQNGLARGSSYGGSRRRMSIEEALDVLELDSTANAYEISEAHRQLEEKLDPIVGSNKYFTSKINEARDILLGN